MGNLHEVHLLLAHELPFLLHRFRDGDHLPNCQSSSLLLAHGRLQCRSMGSRQCRSILVFGFSDEVECRTMSRLFCRSMVHSSSKRNDVEVFFLIKNCSVLCSSFLLIIFIILLRMHVVSGVCCYSRVVVVVLPIFWTTVDRFFSWYVSRVWEGTVDRCCSVSFDRRRVLCLLFCSTVACCNDFWISYYSGGRMWLLDWNRIVMDMSVRHNWFVCKLHIAPTIDKKALPSNREEFQFRLISKTWKLTGTRVLQICTSRSLTIRPEFL